MFLSMISVLRVSGLIWFVLVSPDLDWAVWTISGGMFAWTCLLASTGRWMTYLGALVLAGSVLQILPTVFLSSGFLLGLSRIGGILMPLAVIAATIQCVRNSRGLFSISPAESSRLLLQFSFSLIVPLQIWSIATMLRVARPRLYPQFDATVAFERSLLLLYPSTAILFVLLVTEWLWHPIVSKIVKGSRRYMTLPRSLPPDVDEKGALAWKLLVSFSVLAGAVVSSCQWLWGYPLGDDAKYYYSVLHRMGTEGSQAAWSTERPLLFLVLYFFEKTLCQDLTQLLRLVPVVLASILVILTYYFARFLGQSERIGAFAALFVAVSPHITVGVDYFIIANWLGISLMILIFWGFSKCIMKRSTRWALLTAVLSAVTFGLHYFTWLFVITTLLVYFLQNLVERRSVGTHENRLRFLLILACVMPILPGVLIAHVVGGGLLASLRLAQHMISSFLSEATPVNFVTFLLNRERVYDYFAREHYAIPLLYALASIGFCRLSGLRSEPGRLVRSWVLSSSLGILVVRINELWRFLYMVPFEILAALGLATLFGHIDLNRESVAMRSDRSYLLRTGIEIFVFVAFGLMLTFSTLPSSMLLLSLFVIALVELFFPTIEEWSDATFSVIIFLALEQVARAVYVLA